MLHYLMINRGSVLSHKQIYRKVFDGEYDESTSDVIYSTLKRLRKKIKEVSAVEYIETVKDVGYRLIAGRDRKQGA
jgi:DNA-binding response OmpR family regulator